MCVCACVYYLFPGVSFWLVFPIFPVHSRYHPGRHPMEHFFSGGWVDWVAVSQSHRRKRQSKRESVSRRAREKEKQQNHPVKRRHPPDRWPCRSRPSSFVVRPTFPAVAGVSSITDEANAGSWRRINRPVRLPHPA